MIHHLRAAGVSLVLDARGAGVPVVRPLGPRPRRPRRRRPRSARRRGGPRRAARARSTCRCGSSLLPTLADGWSAAGPRSPCAGVARRRPRTVATTAATATSSTTVERAGTDAVHRVTATSSSPPHGRAAACAHGVAQPRRRRRSRWPAPTSRCRCRTGPPSVLDFIGAAGRTSAGRSAHRSSTGVWLRETRHGRGGHDDAFLLVAGTPGSASAPARCGPTHVAWSGDTAAWVERSALGPAVLGARRAPRAGRARPRAGRARTRRRGSSPCGRTPASTASPTGCTRGSGRGRRSGGHGRVVLNTWEAVYFDQSLERLRAARRRRGRASASSGSCSTTAGSTDAATTGAPSATGPSTPATGRTASHPLIERVHDARHGVRALGRARDGQPRLRRSPARIPTGCSAGRATSTWRQQHVLDLAAPGASDARASTGSTRCSPNTRSPTSSGTTTATCSADRPTRRPGLYRAARPPARRASRRRDRIVRLGRRAHRPRASSSASTGSGRATPTTRSSGSASSAGRASLMPPEYLGAHVGARARAHHRTHLRALASGSRPRCSARRHRVGTSPTRPPASSTRVAAWARRVPASSARCCTPAGRAGRHRDDAAQLVHGVVAPDRMRARSSRTRCSAPRGGRCPRRRCGSPGSTPTPLPGATLDARRRRRRTVQDAAPPWLAAGAIELPGAVLAEVGLPVPLLTPGSALVLHLEALPA